MKTRRPEGGGKVVPSGLIPPDLFSKVLTKKESESKGRNPAVFVPPKSRQSSIIWRDGGER